MNDMDRSEAIGKIAALIHGTKIAMLTTRSGQRLHSRPMATQKADFEGDVWFLSREESEKIDEIAHGAMVNLTYVNSDTHAYVSLSGRAELTGDRTKIEELWRPMHYAWFPLGKDDPEITVIRVTVEDAEYWEAPGNALVRSYQLLKAVVTQGRSKVGDHQKLALD